MTQPASLRALVVYFSRGGATRAVAEAIVRATGADCEELREARSRRGLLGWLRSGYEATYRRAAVTLPLEHDLRAYELVFVGSPTWNGALSSPVRGFLLAHRHELPSLVLFATHGGGGAERVLSEMAELAGKPAVAQLALLDADARRGPAVEVGELIESVYSAREQAPPSASKSCVPGRAALAGASGEPWSPR